MWNNAGLSTSILITTCSPANGMVLHTVAKIFVSTKLRDLGPKSSAARTFWRMVATCIRYQPPTTHLLWDLVTFSLASVKTPCVGTSFLGLAYPFFPPDIPDDTPEFPQIPPICSGDYIPAIGGHDGFILAVVTPLPPAGLLETVLLSLKEGEETTFELSSEKKASGLRGSDIASAARDHSPARQLHQKPTMQLVTTVDLRDNEWRKISVEDVERLAASAPTVDSLPNIQLRLEERFTSTLLQLSRDPVDDRDMYLTWVVISV
ncbi:hypothetical protein HD554DRAFT_2329468 [Boletus coccyginus]|nr:hypothetical protein HD554DRAFT_2329468 [Boletus coccyginus]